MRAHFKKVLTDNSGNVIETPVTVRVLQPGTVTMIVDTLYADGSSGTTLTNPWTIPSGGKIDFYLDEPQRVRLGITVSGSPEEFEEDVDVLAAATDSIHPGTGTDSLQVGLDAAATGDMSVALGVETAAASHAVAVGHSAAATDDQATAVGEQAAATQAGAVALGPSAQSDGIQATAVGVGATASHDKATALGAGAQTTQASQVMLGTSGDIVEIAGSGVVTSPSGNRFMIIVSDDGQLMTQLIQTPDME